MEYFFRGSLIIALLSLVMLFVEPQGSHGFYLTLASLIASGLVAAVSGTMLALRNKREL
jgi:hypothetical protein